MRTYSEQGGDAVAYENSVVNVVNNGLSVGGSSILPGVSLSGVSVSFTPSTSGTRPRTVTVSVDSFTVNGAIWPITMTGKPSSTFPFLGRYVPPGMP